MAYAQGMGRSSIVVISLLLSIDYSIRICAYFNMGKKVIEALMCRLSLHDEQSWAYYHYDTTINAITSYLIPAIILLISLPFALCSKISHLKVYARILFYLSCFVLGLVVIAVLTHHELSHPKVTE